MDEPAGDQLWGRQSRYIFAIKTNVAVTPQRYFVLPAPNVRLAPSDIRVQSVPVVALVPTVGFAYALSTQELVGIAWSRVIGTAVYVTGLWVIVVRSRSMTSRLRYVPSNPASPRFP